MLHLHYTYATVTLHLYYIHSILQFLSCFIYVTLTLHTPYYFILTLHLCYTYITFMWHFIFGLHSCYIYIIVMLQSHYIYVTYTPHLCNIHVKSMLHLWYSRISSILHFIHIYMAFILHIQIIHSNYTTFPLHLCYITFLLHLLGIALTGTDSITDEQLCIHVWTVSYSVCLDTAALGEGRFVFSISLQGFYSLPGYTWRKDPGWRSRSWG